MRISRLRRFACVLCLLAALAAYGQKPGGGKSGSRRCRLVTLDGQVAAGSEWHASLGKGPFEMEWMIRLFPLPRGMSGMSGWDLVVSPVADQGYPDALLLASPPYGSLNSREIATTYGMRAQDAIAWSPRHFHFFTTLEGMRAARPLYRTLLDPGASAADRDRSAREMLDLTSALDQVGAGRFEILDGHLVAGSADAAPFAAQWAAHFDGMPHTLDPDGGKATPKGELHALTFRVSLWLPISWNPPKGQGIVPVGCSE